MEIQVKTDFQAKNLSKGEKIILGSAGVAVISLFLPWQDLGLLGSLLGISDYAWLPFLLGWGLPITMIFKPIQVKPAIVFGGVLLAFLWSVIYLMQARIENPFTDESVSTASWGVLIFCLAALVLGLGVMLKNKVKNATELMTMVKEDLQSLKK